jgi:hypothetical protein
MRRRRWRWATVLALAGVAAALSGCYYDPYTGWYYPYPPPPPYPYASPPPAPYAAPPANPSGAAPPANGSVTQTPLPPP